MFEIEGIVLRTTPFKDNDMMVNVISSDGLYSFLARGVMKLESKNSTSINRLAKSLFCLSKGKDGYSLRQGSLIDSFENSKSSLESLLSLDFINEVTIKLVNNNEDASSVYPVLNKTLCLLDDGFDQISTCLLYLASLLKKIGSGLDVDECVICHEKGQIGAISYLDGGFICPNCFNALKHVRYDKEQLNIVRYIFKVDIDKYGTTAFSKEKAIAILKDLVIFTENTFDIKIKSAKNLIFE